MYVRNVLMIDSHLYAEERNSMNETDIILKQCIKCKKKYPATAEHFYRVSRNKDGLDYRCKECAATYVRKWQKTERGRKSLKKHSKLYNQRHKEEIRKRNRIYYEKNKDKLLKYSKEYKIKNPRKIKQRRKSIFKEALFNYFINKYFRCDKKSLMSYWVFEKYFFEFIEKFNVKYSPQYISTLLYKNKIVNQIKTGVGSHTAGVRKRQRKLQGIILNEKGRKRFEIVNLCNIEINETEITPQDACVYLNCKPAQKYLKSHYKKLGFADSTFNKANEILKNFERIYGIGKHLNIKGVSSASLYMASLNIENNNTQKEIAVAFDCSDALLRKYYKLIRQTYL